jgi:hypothetical protein
VNIDSHDRTAHQTHGQTAEAMRQLDELGLRGSRRRVALRAPTNHSKPTLNAAMVIAAATPPSLSAAGG